jgi:hypothetical protein
MFPDGKLNGAKAVDAYLREDPTALGQIKREVITYSIVGNDMVDDATKEVLTDAAL